jgi:hypothetical protein
MNNPDHTARRIAAINAVVERNPDAFQPKVHPTKGKVRKPLFLLLFCKKKMFSPNVVK